ncbi:MAG: acyl-CoA dehydratase activase [Deferribacterota bacterium]|nr:acyl-CoA dehydratase activase [Deferribacterota bacterium]
MTKQIIGIDIGSRFFKAIVIDNNYSIKDKLYIPTEGQPLNIFKTYISQKQKTYSNFAIVLTGSAGKNIAIEEGFPYINEVVCHAKGAYFTDNNIRSIIEIGAESSKLIKIKPHSNNSLSIEDFTINSKCAAGTGVFLDQQAYRLNLNIGEFSKKALLSENPPLIAGRCSVFAKSDMIHLQQIGTPDYDIIAGLCYAVARNYYSTICKNEIPPLKISFQGGVAANEGVRRAFLDILGIDENSFIVSEHYNFLAAIGAVVEYLENRFVDKSKIYFINKNKELHNSNSSNQILKKPLYRLSESLKNFYDCPIYIGIDIGSVSTNVAIIDSSGNLVAKTYLPTEGNPIRAIKKSFEQLDNKIKENANVRGVCTTGSGRYLIGELVGADLIKNEITAQAMAAKYIDKDVDTIFEIGGQDSKYISLNTRGVEDFTMNKVCAAGTGSFLEEQAEILGINIKNEFSNLAFKSKNPLPLGDRCTVFIGSEVTKAVCDNEKIEDILAGLSYSIVKNYLFRVVGNKKIGKKIFFQGGVAFNEAVHSAFNNILKQDIYVSPHHEVTGAIGAALLVKKYIGDKKSNFKGFNIDKEIVDVSSFECNGCSNSCRIIKIKRDNGKSLFYGGRCGKYENTKKKIEQNIDNLFHLRNDILFKYTNTGLENNKKRGVIGLPQIFYQWELIPLFSTFLSKLGFNITISPITNNKILKDGLKLCSYDTCLPIKVAYGHIKYLLEKGIKNIFIPSICEMFQTKNAKHFHNCPLVQGFPFTLFSSFDRNSINVFSPILFLNEDLDEIVSILYNEFGKYFNIKKKEIKTAYLEGYRNYNNFKKELKEASKNYIEKFKDKNIYIIIGRPYNTYDFGLNIYLADKIYEMGKIAAPMDFFNIDEEYCGLVDNMYWKSGQRILNLCKLISEDQNLHGIYVTNFGCGPDSFISQFFRRNMKKTYLELEIDEHTADAGIITRLEAFFDSTDKLLLT